MKICENNGCDNPIRVPSLDCPGQCLECAEEARQRVDAGLRAARKWALEVLKINADKLQETPCAK